MRDEQQPGLELLHGLRQPLLAFKITVAERNAVDTSSVAPSGMNSAARSSLTFRL